LFVFRFSFCLSMRVPPADASNHRPRYSFFVLRFSFCTAMSDFRYAVRVLFKSPGFTAIAVLTLALGIGANTAMFAVVNAVLLKPLPFADADRLMLVHMTAPDRESPGVFHETVWSYPKYRSFLELQKVFDNTAMFAQRDITLSGDDTPERVRGEVITERYPAILGIHPIAGRAFTGEEANREGQTPVALIGHALWQRRFAGDRAIVGRTIQISAQPYTVVGVLPSGFRGLNGNAEVWLPLAALEPIELTDAWSHSYSVVARRRPDVTADAAAAAVRVHGAQIADAFAQRPEQKAWGATATSLSDSRADADVRRVSWILLGAVGFVLLIASVNLTNLLLAKTIGRRREVAVRVAIGASRRRIARQFLTESLVLAGIGAAAGLLLATLILDAAAALLPESDVFFESEISPAARRIPGAAGLTRIGAAMIGFDPVTLLFTVAVMLVTALFIALVPALQASSVQPIDTLKTGGAAGTARGLHVSGVRAALVMAQVALALVLLAGAGLMVKSAARLAGTSIGIDADGVLTAQIDLPGTKYDGDTGRLFFAQLAERVRAIAGVESAGLAMCAPVSGGCNGTTIGFVRGKHGSTGKAPLVGIHWATPDYFRALRIELRRGRLFAEQDRAGQPKVVLVNEAAARAFWPNADPIGKTVTLGQGGFRDGAEVVGVVANVRYRAIETPHEPDVYVPLAQSYKPFMRLFVRSRLDPRSLTAAIRTEVRALDSTLPLVEVKTMDERVGDAMWRTRVTAWLLSAFAGLALLLTGVGIFGVMAQTVSQRTPEIGIRMALGAHAGDVLRLVVGRSALLTVVGVAIGIVCALGLTQVMAALLYQVEPGDPSTLAAVAFLLTLVALLACYLPARRATRIDPVTALRAE
jgi:putative ABC transport system permease protein